MKSDHTILLLSFPLFLGVVLTSCAGLFIPGFYLKETTHWQAQSIGQDMIDLFIVSPVLLVGAILGFGGNVGAPVFMGLLMACSLYLFIRHVKEFKKEFQPPYASLT